ncbi:MAG TPA: anti-sigma factor antagonist [Phycisphaerae bacterium]|nr:anti-sigma factor antagonist [Phycisphaerae bacterium]
MPGTSPQLNTVVENDIMVTELISQKILDEVIIAEIGDQLNSMATGSQSPRMVLDFSAVSHMSSSALGMLITLHKRLRERDGELRLCCVQPSIYEVFVITRLNEIFQICKSRQEAIDSL